MNHKMEEKRHAGHVGQSSIVVPSRAVRLSVVPLNVAMMSAAPVSVVHACGHDAERYG